MPGRPNARPVAARPLKRAVVRARDDETARDAVAGAEDVLDGDLRSREGSEERLIERADASGAWFDACVAVELRRGCVDFKIARQVASIEV